MTEQQNIEWKKSWHDSNHCNPLIADACFKAGYIDTWGRGTLKIINSCKEAELPEPEIIEKDGGIQVTIFKELVGGSISGSISGSIGGSIGLTDRQREIVELILQNNKISYRNIADIIGINESAVKKHLNTLKNKCVLKRIGGTRGHWEIINKIN